MNHVDSAFGRLASAWSLAGAGRAPVSVSGVETKSTPERIVPAALSRNAVSVALIVEPIDSPSVPWVMVARHKLRPPSAFDCGLLASAHLDERVYRIDPIVVDGIGELETHWRARSPRLLLLDIELIRNGGSGAMEQLRRRLPGTDFLLGCEGSMTGLDVTTFRHVRGCIDWALSSEQLTRALDGVMSGELWFPRSVMQSVCLDLLEGSHTASDRGGPVAGALTAREREVLTLMRLGLTNKQIGERLDISVNTVKKHLGQVFEKRGLHRRRQDFQ